MLNLFFFDDFDLATITTKIMSFIQIQHLFLYSNIKYTNLYFTCIAEVQIINDDEDI